MSKTRPEPPRMLSLCLICGNEGAKTLVNLLKSALNRPSGPMVDEVSIFWNGDDEHKPDYLDGSPWKAPGGEEVPFIVTEGEWPKDFSKARNISFEAATGAWRMWADSDDILSNADEEDSQVVLAEIAESVQQGSGSYEIGGTLNSEGPVVRSVSSPSGEVASTTLKDFIDNLPPHINSVWLPYNYIEVEGRCLQRLPRNRIVRWADGWSWHMAVHEDMTTTGGNVSRPAYLPGLIVRHRPSVDADSRGARNAAILSKVKEELGEDVDHRTLYGLAATFFDANNDVDAIEYLNRALTCPTGAPPPQDAFVYHSLLVQIHTRGGNHAEAVEHAMKAIVAQPTRPGGYLEMGRSRFMAGDYAEALIWMRKGFALHDEALSTLQTPMLFQGQIRSIGAHALISLGAVDEAYQWAQMAAEADPGFFAQTTLKACTEAMQHKKAEESFTALAEHLRADGDVQRLRKLAEAAPAVVEGGHQFLRLYQELAPERDIDANGVLPDPIPVPDKINTGEEDGPVVGAELLQVSDPDALLSRAEGGGKAVRLIVPDSGRPLPFSPDGRKATYTAGRLHRLLSGRGKVESLHTVQIDATQSSGDYWLMGRYQPGPPATGRRVGIWCPHFADHWGPDDPENRGTGGSEEAVLYLSRELVRRGYQVEVFAPLPSQDRPLRVESGVVWRRLTEFSHALKFDHLILHRSPWATGVTEYAADNLWVWHHDHFYEKDAWSPRTSERARHLFVSRWQRRLLEGFNGGPVRGWTIYNGVPVEQFERAREFVDQQRLKRDSRAIIFSSNPTRGLDRLVELWGEITTHVPDAKLHVYYGMQTAYQVFWRGAVPGVQEMLAKLQEDVRRLQATGACFVHGRVGQESLTRDMLLSGVMAYPSDFPEVHMISAARSAAAGMKLVTTDAGCLRETSPEQSYMVDRAQGYEDWIAGGREAFIIKLVQALSEPEDRYDREAVAADTLRRYSWKRVADRLVQALDMAEAGDDDGLVSDVWDAPVAEDAPEVPDGIDESSGIRMPTDPALLQHTSLEASIKVTA